jgi:hypothetical protein
MPDRLLKRSRRIASGNSDGSTSVTTPLGGRGGMMLRKQILTEWPASSGVRTGEMEIASIATVWVTSEAVDHPVDYAFDNHRGPGGSHWVAAVPGEQRLILAFDQPQTLRTITVEVEELEVSRTQELQVGISFDGGQTFQTLRRQEYTFSPPGTTFEREEWAISVAGVTHLQVVIIPDKGGNPCRATLTTLALR